jgi:hypothetical protein
MGNHHYINVLKASTTTTTKILFFLRVVSADFQTSISEARQ